MSSRRATTALIAAACCMSLATPAHAYDVTPDVADGVCRVDPKQQDSDVAQFWMSLREDAVNQRLTELDAADPGLRQAIEDYDYDRPGAPEPGELQERIAATGTNEGIGMFIPHRTATADGVGDQAGDKTTYTPAEARAAARAIGDNPSNAPQDSLDKQAATSHLRLDEITAELFSQRHAAYDATQHRLADNLNACADEVEEATKPGPFSGPWPVVIALAVAFVIGLTIRILVNRRKPSRHAA